MTVRQLWNRLLALALAVLPLCFGIWVAVGWLYSAHTMLSRQTAETRSNLRRYETLLEREKEIELAVERARFRARNHYWSGSTEAVAAETLQNQLRAVVETAGAELQQVEALDPARNDENPSVKLHVTVHGTPTEVLEALYSLESYRPYLFLDRLYVRALEKSKGAEQAQERLLQASMDVLGYVEVETQPRGQQ